MWSRRVFLINRKLGLLPPSMFGDDRRREINLGGSQLTATQQSVLAQVQQERERRHNERMRLEATSVIQAAWRAYTEASITRENLRREFDAEPLETLRSARLLLFGGGERKRLLVWTNAALNAGDAFLSDRMSGSDAMSWLVLLKQLAYMMLTQITNDPL
jgi:ubiquitin-protein ligase E3 C